MRAEEPGGTTLRHRLAGNQFELRPLVLPAAHETAIQANGDRAFRWRPFALISRTTPADEAKVQTVLLVHKATASGSAPKPFTRQANASRQLALFRRNWLGGGPPS
jgi:hypothetical protein